MNPSLPQPGELTSFSLLQAAELIRNRKVSPVDLTNACLHRIEQLNSTLNAFITVIADRALQEARRAEAEIYKGQWKGPLHGIPIALKDNVDTAGVRTTSASHVSRDRIPASDAEVAKRLKSANAVLLGKLNLHEFAYGGSGIISAFGPVRNPHDPEHITGGSSSGSAAAVASGMCFAAIGTDTSGSIRLPAAYCGIVGLKPTFGRVSCCGIVPLSLSLDHAGPMTRSVADAATFLQLIAGYDPQDLYSQDQPVPDYSSALDQAVSGLCIGIPREMFFQHLDPDIGACVEAAINFLRKEVADVREMPPLPDADRTVFTTEAWAYHADYVAKNPDLYQPETLRRIRTGSQINAADYVRKRQELEAVRRKAPDLFADIDLIVTPTSPIPAPTIAELQDDPSKLRPAELLMLRNTRPFNILGLPTISIPCGFTNNGMPVGLQISGPPWREDLVLRLAKVLEGHSAPL
jgi:aspartyl-tRNA(Asn)/glutamyl-tRNA(Gln) amidotransferase subunit A